MLCRKVYRLRLYPTKAQAQKMYAQACAQRFVWNWALADRKQYYEDTQKSLTFFDQCKRFVLLKQQEDTAWLREYSAHSFLITLNDVQKAFAAFFAKRSGYPKFKSKHRSAVSFGDQQSVRYEHGRVWVPKIGWVKARGYQEIPEPTKQARFVRDAQGRWFASLVAEFEMPDVALPAPRNGVGLDLGLTSFVTLSDGQKIEPLQAYRRSQRKLARAQRRLSRKQKGSQNYEKQRQRVARLHAKVRQQRQEFLHQLSHDLTQTYDLIAVEDLAVTELAQTCLAKHVHDAAWSEFVRQLDYKSLWRRKHFTKIDRFFASSKTCSSCGAVREHLPLSIRTWQCDCGVVHDRDINAALNIYQQAMQRHISISPEVTS